MLHLFQLHLFQLHLFQWKSEWKRRTRRKIKNNPVRSRLTGLLVLLGLFVLTDCARMSRINYLKVYSRDGWQRPEKIIDVLQIKPGDTVADIGAGKGYFTRFLSDAVGPTGKVYAVEIGAKELTALRELAAREGRENIEVIQGRPTESGLPAGKIDLVFLLNTYHHIKDRVAYFGAVRRVLQPDGRLAIVDMKDDLTGFLRLMATEGHWSSRETIHAELAAAGFRLLNSYDFLAVQNFEVLERQK